MQTTRSKQVFIFEGPDGSGKSTAAVKFASDIGARYVHCGPFKGVHQSLPRFYAEAMLPAILGYQDVVLDRCWLSEIPYGDVYRGESRLSTIDIRILERLALRCGAVVIKCLPEYEVVLRNYLGRKEIEMLDNEDQLKGVYDRYSNMRTDLTSVNYDYTKDDFNIVSRSALLSSPPCHDVKYRTSGNWLANIIIIGDSPLDHTDYDPFYQWPFGSFSGSGCSHWLTSKLNESSASECDLLWGNSNDNLMWLEPRIEQYLENPTVFALGDKSYQRAYAFFQDTIRVPHPQYWKKFRNSEQYPLITMIEELPQGD